MATPLGDKLRTYQQRKRPTWVDGLTPDQQRELLAEAAAMSRGDYAVSILGAARVIREHYKLAVGVNTIRDWLARQLDAQPAQKQTGKRR